MIYDKKELNKYPDIMSKEDMRKVCHISKRTAQFLLEFNLIPHICTGKKTRCYKIKKSDVIAFMTDREINPERYIAPEKWYKYGTAKAYKIRILPEMPEPDKMRRYYESVLKDKPDVFSVQDIVQLTDYNYRTVGSWIREKKLRALVLPSKYMVPKAWLIDWLSSESYNGFSRKTKKHIDTLWTMSKWSDEVEYEKAKKSCTKRAGKGK